jgi:hypothetical protein
MIHAEAVYIFSSRYPDLSWEYITSVSGHCDLGSNLAVDIGDIYFACASCTSQLAT